MMSDVRELLPLYALGVLDADEAELVERAIAADPALAAELVALQAASDALVEPIAPAADVHARLMASTGGGRFEKLSARMASLFDVTVERAREILGLIERPASWEQPMPGLGLVHFDGGPAYEAADCGFVRLAPGTAFPHHSHQGEEVSLILAGTLRDHTGRTYGPGDEIVSPAGSEHDVMCDGDTDCIYAARAIHGISIAGAPARPPHKS
jgi:putative transcriptional regulator